jgi:hypothetical protein
MIWVATETASKFLCSLSNISPIFIKFRFRNAFTVLAARRINITEKISAFPFMKHSNVRLSLPPIPMLAINKRSLGATNPS